MLLKNLFLKSLFLLIISILLSFQLYSHEEELYLMPMPREIKRLQGEFIIQKDFGINILGPYSHRVLKAKQRFLSRLAKRTGIFFSLNPEKLLLNLEYKKIAKLSLFMNESYLLKISENNILVRAETDIGIVRGLETLLQLLRNNGKNYFFPAIEIKDYPRFPWRGLLIDVSRHFMPVDVIKRNLDTMASVKLNVLHLHLTDDQGFRVESKSYPRLHEVASDGDYYTQSQIKEIIDYADERGIRVVPEFDMPGHTTSWIVAYPGLGSISMPYKMERAYGVKNPVLDPSRKFVYKFLEKFFKEMSKLFPDPYFHIGGDEVNGKHWNQSNRIQKFMKKNKIRNNKELQAYFNKKIQKILRKYNKKIIGWDEILESDLPKDTVIQCWRDKKILYQIIKKGYYTILSNGYYLDLCLPSSYHYLNDPIPEQIELFDSEKKRILGGEAAMWSELVNAENIDSRIWPRTAVIAERLWSSSDLKDISNMYKRLEKLSLYLDSLGACHIKNQEMMLRRLCNSREISILKEFIRVVEPVKYYSRHKSRPYTIFSPLSRVVDAAIPDPSFPRYFAGLVDNYLQTNDKGLENKILEILMRWKGLHSRLLQLSSNSPVLKEILPLSNNLSKISEICIKAIKMKNRGETMDIHWLQEAINALETAKQPYAELELIVVDSIEKIIKSLEK
ncbi:family 20 glycosylhydrolase [Candidatus Aminicenantes bacterium AC-335-L06]|nr:family 20 glycosylhydrolase [Candidatus Aminicenantes bacterium AC-335-L06]